jgi:hypothetical protein
VYHRLLSRHGPPVPRGAAFRDRRTWCVKSTCWRSSVALTASNSPLAGWAGGRCVRGDAGKTGDGSPAGAWQGTRKGLPLSECDRASLPSPVQAGATRRFAKSGGSSAACGHSPVNATLERTHLAAHAVQAVHGPSRVQRGHHRHWHSLGLWQCPHAHARPPRAGRSDTSDARVCSHPDVYTDGLPQGQSVRHVASRLPPLGAHSVGSPQPSQRSFPGAAGHIRWRVCAYQNGPLAPVRRAGGLPAAFRGASRTARGTAYAPLTGLRWAEGVLRITRPATSQRALPQLPP